MFKAESLFMQMKKLQRNFHINKINIKNYGINIEVNFPN